ncbi:ABC transporter substrate-binding protein [Novosphingobium sp. ZW T3_23]|uniref:ABC transporter substrate-binding protein n=1 Tax=Novosphingobium sp. ZW T3_23 TaxID=3378084 RepID=UPI00385215AE
MATQPAPSASSAPDEIWFTRCPVPTATGLAYKLGWLTEEFAAEGIPVRTLQESTPEIALRHYDHRLPTLIREGGNILAFAARAQGEPTKLVGLTWIEESQVILVRPDSGITQPAHLKGKRLALPGWTDHEIPSHIRGTSIGRGMSLLGYKGALHTAGLTFDDVELIEVDGTIRNIGGAGRDSQQGRGSLNKLWAIDALADGEVDAVYVKGASALDGAREAGVVVGIDLDDLPNRSSRVNNGTPRPITVHQSLIDDHFDYLVRFLESTLRAADWAAQNVAQVHEILQSETRGSVEAVTQAYGADFHKTLHPTLDAERLALFDQQKKALGLFGFLERDFALADWVDPRPLEAAYERLERNR